MLSGASVLWSTVGHRMVQLMFDANAAHSSAPLKVTLTFSWTWILVVSTAVVQLVLVTCSRDTWLRTCARLMLQQQAQTSDPAATVASVQMVRPPFASTPHEHSGHVEPLASPSAAPRSCSPHLCLLPYPRAAALPPTALAAPSCCGEELLHDDSAPITVHFDAPAAGLAEDLPCVPMQQRLDKSEHKAASVNGEFAETAASRARKQVVMFKSAQLEQWQRLAQVLELSGPGDAQAFANKFHYTQQQIDEILVGM